jgi:hypothetical protein
MSGIFTVTVSEARGNVAVPANIDNTAIVMGCSSAGSGLSPFYLSGQSAQAALGYGDAVDTLCQIVEQKQQSGNQVPKRPAALYTLPADDDGSYGAVDDSGVTGTVTFDVDDTVYPFGTFEAQAICVDSGTVGTAGITYKTSLDGGRHYGQKTALGTAAEITIAAGNVKFTLDPPALDIATLYTLTDAIYTKLNAHEINVTGYPAIHGASDVADNVNGTTYPAATTPATCIARLNACRASLYAHVYKTAGGVHGATDPTHGPTVPICTDLTSAVTLAVNLKAQLTAHQGTTGSVHGSADSNTITAPAPTAGTWLAGDVVKVRTIAPTVSGSDVTAAFAVLARSSTQFGLVVADFPCDSAMFTILSAGRAALLLTGKRVTVLTRARIPDAETSETEAVWAAAVAADLHGSYDSTINMVCTYGLVTDAMTGNQYLRSDLQQWAADVVRVDRSVWPNCPDDQPEQNFTLANATGTDVGHDEGPRGALTGLSDADQGNRFVCSQRLPDAARLEEVFSTVPWVMFAPGEKIQNLMVRRIANAMEREAVSAGNTGLGGKLRYNPASGNTPAMLTEPSRRAAQGMIYQTLARDFAADIQNAADAALDTGLVQVNPRVTVTGGNLLGISVTLAPLVFGYLLNLSITLAVQE